MSAYGRAFSTRLFIQAAFTGLLAPTNSHGSTWMTVTFAIAAAALAVALLARNGHERTRELVIGFEAVAVAVGVVGLIGHHYIPGTIVGVAALITALNHPPARVPAPVVPPVAAVPPQPYATPDPTAPLHPGAGQQPGRAMNILPGS